MFLNRKHLLVSILLLVVAAPMARAHDGEEWSKPDALSFSIDYTLVSDYVFRGINFSEYAGEGREKPNHQMSTGIELATEEYGTFGASFWFEWFAGQKSLTPGSDNLQEVDYVVYWNYDIEQIATNIELGWIAYTFPPSSGDAYDTFEVYVALSYDDSGLFGTEESVLNPYIYYGLDYDLGRNGSWIELGISHDFALNEVAGLEAAPVVKDLTISPSLVLGIDHRYLDKFAVAGTGGPSTKLANLNYGLAISYDVSGALGLDPKCGSLSLGGFLNFSQALRKGLLNDEFYGGMSVSYDW